MTRVMRDRSHLGGRGDRGDTLVEILIALVIIALAVGPVLGTLIESLASSAEQRGLAAVDTLLKSFAETAKAGVELSAPAGRGAPNGVTVTSSVLFTGTNTFKGDGISGAGIPATTTITAENNDTHKATLSSPAIPEPTETLSIVLFRRCATTYPLLSRPSKLEGPPGSIVTVFGTGFGSALAWTTFHVIVGGKAATILATQSLTKSDSHGNIGVTFKVPALTPTPSPRTIVLTGLSATGTSVAVASFPGDGFTVTTGTASTARSSEARYSLGIVGVSYWNLTTGAFGSSCTPSKSTGVQLITLRATPPTGGSTELSFVLRNPSYFAPPVPTPTVLVTGKSVAHPYATEASTKRLPLVFTAAVSSSATNPAPTGTVTWALTTPTGAHPACSSLSQAVAAGTKTLVATCKLTLATTNKVGLYTALATYPGDAFNTQASGSGTATVYSPDGSGTMTISPTAVFTSSTHTLKLTYTPASGGTGNGQLSILVPANWPLPQATTAAMPGFTSVAGGSGGDAVTIVGRTIEVSGITLTSTVLHQQLTVTIAAETAPSARGRYQFTTSEYSTVGGSTTTLRSTPPQVIVTVTDVILTGGTATSGKTTSTPTFAMTSGDRYLVYVFSSLSGSGDKATSIKSTGFSPALSFKEIGTQQTFDGAKDNAWVWYVKPTTGSGTITVTLHNTIKQAYIEVVQLVGVASGTPPEVTSSKGFHVSSAAGTHASATLSSSAPSTPTDPEVLFLGAEGSLGTTVPPLPGFVTTTKGFAHTAGGSFAMYTGLATRSASVSIPSNWWGTVALEIHG